MNTKSLSVREKLVGRHVFTFNPQDNGGESLFITTEIWDNGDETDNIYCNQKLTLASYGNSASFALSGATLNPENLMKLALELSAAFTKAKSGELMHNFELYQLFCAHNQGWFVYFQNQKISPVLQNLKAAKAWAEAKFNVLSWRSQERTIYKTTYAVPKRARNEED